MKIPINQDCNHKWITVKNDPDYIEICKRCKATFQVRKVENEKTKDMG